ncbi:uncharacterized protein SCHCODRAFT_02666158 [Schizophyllum commune H4-8]|uniref:Uncharacterized protein n=1 Tax=Schizophyllum commune (strain H4-8 / FGSC 9210) TaxID=578458 RepID=D8QM96_SCHCM|nr:uncharacterized protein SCHCODRAFT_02666158 [Schizophyllum commune H4-8]KAI5892978.1 hypothetical protein SCHCODRAFT_02666158 [Schizophyllum commune H4-8]
MTDLPGHPFMLPPSAAAGIMALSRSPSVHAGDAGEVHMTLRYPDDSEDDDAVDPMDNRESAASISISASTQASTISVDTPSARRTSQRLSGRSSHKYGAGKSERRGRKPKFARDQRATIRAMDQRGYSIGDIKVAFPASDLTIKSIITNSGRRDDLSEDQSYVDAEIMQKYPAKNGSSSSACRASQIVPSKRRQETIVPAPVPGAYAEAFDLRAMSKQPITTGKSCVAGLEAHASRDTNPPADSVGQITGAGTASTIQGSHHPTTASASMLAGTTQNASSSTTIPSAKTLKVDFAAAFLANLDVDLSAHHDALVKCYLGTAQDVKSRRDWPIEWFRIILDREVPGASVFERFVLARAFKLIKDDGSMEKSLMRTRLDEAPQVWTTSSAGFFEGLALDLSPVFPDFHSAGLGLLGPILAMAGWSEDTRRALFDEALPNLKAIHRFVFERELKGIGAAAQSSPTIIQELVAAVQARHLTGHKTDATTRPLPPTFLANLDHDLLYIAGGLSTCGIATVEDVVSLRSWHAEDLHNMLRQVLPKLVPVERHVLVRGIKNSLGLEMGEHSKSALRYKLDAHPDLGKRTIVEFLSASPYDLAKFAPRLEGAGLSTLESVLVLAEWDVRDLLALLDEALPGFSSNLNEDDIDDIALTLAYPEDWDEVNATDGDPADSAKGSMETRLSVPTTPPKHPIDDMGASDNANTTETPQTSRRLSAGKLASSGGGKGGRPLKYTRGKRADIRLMHARGYSIEEIMAAISAPKPAIIKFISNKDGKDIVAEDWANADAIFLQRYPKKNIAPTIDSSPVIPAKRASDTPESNNSARTKFKNSSASSFEAPPRPTSSIPGSSKFAVAPLPRKSRAQHRQKVGLQSNQSSASSSALVKGVSLTLLGTVHQGTSEAANAAKLTAVKPENASAPAVPPRIEPASSERTIPTDAGAHTSARTMPITVIEVHAPPHVPDFAASFLANLDMDMSTHRTSLVACNLGSAADVVSRRDWPAAWFHTIFERDMPGLSILERHVLIRGFRSISDDGTICKGTIRVWSTPIAGFLSKFAVNLSSCLPSLERAGLRTLGALLAIAGWPQAEQRALLAAALPDLKALPRFVLVRALGEFSDAAPTLSVASLTALVAARASAACPAAPPAPAGSASDFLRNLDHDLSPRAQLLAGRGIATIEDVLALRSWPAGILHEMLKDVAPDLTAVERFVLVRGVRHLPADGGIPKRGRLRALLDTEPGLWCLPLGELLSRSPHHLVRYGPALHLAGFDSARALMATAGWTDEELLALLDEVIPWREAASAGEAKGTAGPSDAS